MRHHTSVGGPARANAPADPPALTGALRWVAAALAVAALAACSGSDDQSSATTSSSSDRVLAGTFTVTVPGADDPCGPIPDHADLVDGAAVVVQDADGREVITGSLGAGAADGASCVRPLELGTVAKLPVYRISVGSYGPIEVSAESLDAAGGNLDLRLGV